MTVSEIKTLTQFSELDRYMIMQLFNHVKGRSNEDKWYDFDGYFDYKGKPHRMVCTFRLGKRFMEFTKKSVEPEDSRIVLLPSCNV